MNIIYQFENNFKVEVNYTVEISENINSRNDKILNFKNDA